MSLVIGTLVSLSGAASAAPFVTGVYGRDSSPTGVDTIQQTGFNTITLSVNLGNIGSQLATMDRMHARGIRVLIWLGSFDRAVRCDFERSDAWTREVVGAIKHHPAIAAFQIADEVDRGTARGCPNVPSQIAARNDVIHSVAPDSDTYVTITAFDGVEWFPYQHYASTADILGLVVYPCVNIKVTCNWARIDKAIMHADADGVSRYWAVMQDFGGSGTYRQPTAAELDEQMNRWRPGRLEGYFFFHWKKGGLDTKPTHLEALRQQNAYYLSR